VLEAAAAFKGVEVVALLATPFMPFFAMPRVPKGRAAGMTRLGADRPEPPGDENAGQQR
jgi:hypothetical protein